jgi:ferredoxin
VSRMSIRADRDVCIGAGMCVVAAPAVFDQDADGLVLLLLVEDSEGSTRPPPARR